MSPFGCVRRTRCGNRTGRIGQEHPGKLVQGLYTPGAGVVRFGGTDIRQIDPADLRAVIGYVPQDLFLFYGSVRENIVLGAPVHGRCRSSSGSGNCRGQ